MKSLGALFLVAAFLVPCEARADWNQVKRFLQPDVRVVQETDETLVLRAPSVARLVVLSDSDTVTCDIRAERKVRRGGNPYRVWQATKTLVEDASLPRSAWGRFFTTPFLRILRMP